MKTMSKQMISFLLVILLCFSVLPVPALATAGETPTEEPQQTEELQQETNSGAPEGMESPAVESTPTPEPTPDPEPTPAPTPAPDSEGTEETPVESEAPDVQDAPAPAEQEEELPPVDETEEPLPIEENPELPELLPMEEPQPVSIGLDIGPISYAVVDEPLVTVTFQYTDAQVATPTNLPTSSISAHSYHPLTKLEGDRMAIPANLFPGEIQVDTNALKVTLDGELDITVQAEYDAATGTLYLPARYWGHEVDVDWYCSYEDVTNITISAQVGVNMGGEFQKETHTLTLPSNADEIAIPLEYGSNTVVSQNGIDLPESAYSIEDGVLYVQASPLGGDITVTAYAEAPRMRLFALRNSSRPTQVQHTRSGDQIWYGYYTSMYTANGNTAFCVDPTVSGLNPGTYDIDYWITNTNDFLLKCCYYLYGGPGYDYVKQVFAEPYADWAYGMCHAVASYAYMGSLDAFKGLEDDLTGQLVQVADIVRSLPAAPDGFEAFVYNAGSGSNQPLVGWQYTPSSWEPDPESEPEPEPTGSVAVRKVSADTSLTDGNPCYSLAGAVFDVYSGSSRVGSITTNANGYGSLSGLPVGSGYSIVERTPPTGFAGTNQEYSFTIYEDDTTAVTVSNIPQNDPTTIMVRKQDADTGKGEPQGGAGLEGAQFTVKYYKGSYSSASALSGATPARTWIIETDEDGFAMLHPDYLVSGDPFYYNSAGTIVTLPLGTVTIQETKAPEGYLINNELFIRQITASGSMESVETYNEPIVKESVIRGGVSVEKWDAQLNKKGAAQGDATLAGAVLEIINRTGKDVVVGGKTYGPGAVVHTLTTDAAGSASTVNNLLPYGEYEIAEKTAPTGYLNTGVVSRSFEIRTNGAVVNLTTADTAIKNDVIRGGVSVEKWDVEIDRNDPQGDATLSGAVFEIYNRSQNSVVVGGMEYAPGTVVHTLTTGEDGSVSTENDLLPYGTYEIVEKTAPTGYLNTGAVRRTFTIREDGVIVEMTGSDTAIKNNVIRGGVEIEKWDIERNEAALKQGDATLAGAVLDIYNTSKYLVLVGGVEYAPGEIVLTLTTDEHGYASTAADALPYGSYKIVERTAPVGYLNSGVIRQGFRIREHGVIVSMTTGDTVIKNDIIRGNVLIEKWDNEIGEHRAQGGGTLEGATFELVNRSLDSVLVQDVLYAPGEVVYTTITDETGTAVTPEYLLPYGTYEVREIAPPFEGYLSTGVLSRFFEIREHGKTVELNTAETAIRNDPLRGDLKGIKIADGTAERLAGVPFSITSKTTGESHIVVTDVNGEFSTASEWNPHSQNTNAGQTDRDGVWFGKLDVLDDSKGALLYDDYIIEELPCEANEGFELLSFEVSVYRHNTVIDLGTLTDDYIPIPEIFTTALEKESMGNTAYAAEKVTIVDTVYYSGLKAGTEYTLKGVLMDKATEEPLMVGENQVTAEKTFRATGESGSATMEFTFDASALKGKAVVVFETLHLTDKEVAAHADIEDVDQTIIFLNPEIGTTATGKNGEKTLDATAETVIVDTVAYMGLQPGQEYTLKGQLMDKATGEAVQVDGQPVTAETTFTPESSDGSVTVTFTLNAIALKAKSVVVFESLLHNGREIAIHADIEDEGQTVSFNEPKIGTTATGPNGEKELSLSAAATIVDTVKYENLAVGQEFTLKGTLMDKATGKPVLVGDKEVTAQTTFTPDQPSGTVDVTFTFNASSLKAKEVVVFERLYIGDAEIAVHADIEDKDQTVSFIEPKIGTKATGKDGEKQLAISKTATIIDKVKYEGLTVGEKYTLKGTLMDKASGKALLVNGKAVTAETTFTPEKADGSVEVTFTFDASALAGKQVVVFERLYIGDAEIAAHADIEDKGQTVSFTEPKIRTSASGKDGEKQIAISRTATIIDKVKYEGLTVGEKYTLKGILMDKATGKALLVDGKEVAAETTFTPEKADGSVEVTFTFDASALKGKEVVVFERLYIGENEIAAHTDIEDKNQTVSFTAYAMKLTKIDRATNKPLDGAEFTLYGEDGKEIKLTKDKNGVYFPDEKGSAIISTVDGVAIIKDLSDQKYTLREVTVPKGYVGYTEPIPFEMEARDTEDDPFPVTVYNSPEGHKEGSGAKTGRDGLPMWALYGGIGLLALAAGVGVLYLRKRKMN